MESVRDFGFVFDWLRNCLVGLDCLVGLVVARYYYYYTSQCNIRSAFIFGGGRENCQITPLAQGGAKKCQTLHHHHHLSPLLSTAEHRPPQLISSMTGPKPTCIQRLPDFLCQTITNKKKSPCSFNCHLLDMRYLIWKAPAALSVIRFITRPRQWAASFDNHLKKHCMAISKITQHSHPHHWLANPLSIRIELATRSDRDSWQ